MKVYHSNEDAPKRKKMGKRGLVALGLSATLAIAALAITLTFVLGGGTNAPIDGGQHTGGQAVLVLPMDEFELGKEFSTERLVKFKTMGFWETHEAVDFLAAAGTPVKAVSDGKVVSVENITSMYGTVVKIEHADGLVSIYKGLAANAPVRVGDTVTAGTTIGTVGIMTMEKNDYNKPHLHLEMEKNGKAVDPLAFLPDIGDK